MNAVVRTWLIEMEGFLDFEDMCRRIACSYANDGLVVARGPALLQRTSNPLCAHFDIVGLKTNTTKTEAMIFLPGGIRTCLTVDA
jgi:hypothetical protein